MGFYPLRISPDGMQLFASAGHDIVSVDLDPNAWVTTACDVAGRSLTDAEWEHYLPDEPYQEECAAQR